MDDQVLKAGSVCDFIGSMAQEMENAFRAEWEKAYPEVELPQRGHLERKVIFSAIAQGVLKHLRERANRSFKMEASVTQKPQEYDQHLIVSENKERITVRHDYPFGYGYESFIDAGDLKVTQISDLIVSSGEPTVKEIKVEDLP